jgi:ubiquinone/menaquinone biosynthesis C-methylase UbiE
VKITMNDERQRAVVEQFDRDSDHYLSKHVRAETIREKMRLFDLAYTGERYARALDLGCGPGTMSEDLLRMSEEVWGVDISEAMVSLATRRISEAPFRSKYPPAEPEALRLLAPQRGLFATVESKSNRNSKSHVMRAAQAMRTETAKSILPELSNFDCLPGRAGGSPYLNSLHFEVGAAEELRFPDAYFDVVFCVGVLRYLNSWEKGLQEIYRVLKPGGVFVATFYYRFSLQWIYMCLLGRPLLPIALMLRGRPLKECFMKHKAEPLPFSYHKFTTVCQEIGFTGLECQHSGFELYPLRRLFPSISRNVYLRLEPICFKSRTFGWLGSICIVKGVKKPSLPSTGN